MADAASIKLPKRIPYHVAMDLLLTGRWFDAEEALRWGHREGNHRRRRTCWPRPGTLARLLESGPPLVYAAIKEVVREAESTAVPGCAEPGHQAADADGGPALFQRGSAGRGAGLCRKARSGVEGALRRLDRCRHSATISTAGDVTELQGQPLDVVCVPQPAFWTGRSGRVCGLRSEGAQPIAHPVPGISARHEEARKRVGRTPRRSCRRPAVCRAFDEGTKRGSCCADTAHLPRPQASTRDRSAPFSGQGLGGVARAGAGRGRMPSATRTCRKVRCLTRQSI